MLTTYDGWVQPSNDDKNEDDLIIIIAIKEIKMEIIGTMEVVIDDELSSYLL